MKNIILLILIVPFSIVLSSPRAHFSPGYQEDPYKAFAEVMPEPVGGLGTVYKSIVYPDLAKKSGVEGKVYLLVYVNETGKVDDVKVVKGLGAGCDEAAINALKNAKFLPGKEKGAPVKVKLSLPVIFKIK